jgi:hypothetical protein
MDMHMYFFAMLALTIAWCDRATIVLAAVVVAVHHLTLDILLPFAVFPDGADVSRVLLHAGIVVFQTAVLVWLSNLLVDSFTRIAVMSEEIAAKNAAIIELDGRRDSGQERRSGRTHPRGRGGQPRQEHVPGQYEP